MMFYKECRPTKLKKRPNYALSILGFRQFQLSVISYQLSVISYQLSVISSLFTVYCLLTTEKTTHSPTPWLF
ncbi:MAG: hypothetical protein EWV61_09620 [Microcystis aeruginosa Ma_AC_P_19900807_S300]|uniref:Similarity. Hypothetical start n=1 Tax=Microcystis aeruginosa (strain PCC 7806) TaxID=267872 RepID=A8YDD6_MICA7|nr:MAG: hypothetical protein EWV61_09620 [Microcystis aeruginosa Ma_AC_P_19900807_S300]CAO89377.1 unnamed protein product [Microcystis aeruginosa PCC 7806]